MVITFERNKYLTYSHIKKDEKKFVAGESRYCQKCRKESHNLVQVTEKTHKLSQLKYCKECAEEYNNKK